MTRMERFLSALRFRRNPGRELARIGAEKRREKIRDKTRQLRVEVGLPPSPALR